MSAPSLFTRLRQSPRAQTALAVFVALAVLVWRKSWALFTPQLWAEDGTIHLNHNDEFGAGAFLIPYRGYLHTFPRLITWLASHTADVAHWPAFYNVSAFLVTGLLFARFLSPRLDAVPGRPWLVLSFVLVAHSGEVFLNITNLHWLTGFFFVQQLLMTRPATLAQRAGDYLLLALAGLSDPSAIIFLPLFLWRWWRERHADHLALLLVVAAGAAVQAYFLKTTAANLGAQTQPLHLAKLLAMTGSRLVIWPFFGPRAVTAWSPVAQAVVAWTLIAALAAWTLRRHERRPLRAWLLGTWAVITFACIYRIRPDHWPVPIENLFYAEPYCYMSRLLLVWLVIWEFTAAPRLVAWVARLACAVGAALALPQAREPAPPDYQWAKHCEPIRRGVPANIPTLPEGWTLEYHGRPARK